VPVPPTPSGWSPTEPPLEEAALAEAAGPSWSVRLLAESESTNADAAASPRAGLVVVADHQTAGRGRLDRTWDTPPGTALTFSAVADPVLPDEQWPLLPLAAALAVADGVRRAADVDPQLKWPNDLLLAGAKLGGVLAERGADGAVVVGFGINVSTRREELPIETATSLALAGARTDREPLVKECLRSLARRYEHFLAARGASDSVLPAYRLRCETIGQEVVVHGPGGETATGIAVDVDDAGLLVVRDASGVERRWSAGDVVHVRGE